MRDTEHFKICMPLNRGLQIRLSKMTELKGKTEKPTIIAGNLNTFLLVIDRLVKQKLNKEMK